MNHRCAHSVPVTVPNVIWPKIHGKQLYEKPFIPDKVGEIFAKKGYKSEKLSVPMMSNDVKRDDRVHPKHACYSTEVTFIHQG